jgi:hypothetical protein
MVACMCAQDVCRIDLGLHAVDYDAVMGEPKWLAKMMIARYMESSMPIS